MKTARHICHILLFKLSNINVSDTVISQRDVFNSIMERHCNQPVSFLVEE